MKNNKRAIMIIAAVTMMILASVSLCGCGKKDIVDLIRNISLQKPD